MKQQELSRHMAEMTSRSRDALDRVVTGYIDSAPLQSKLVDDFTAETLDGLLERGLVTLKRGVCGPYLIYTGGSVSQFHAVQQEVPYA